MNPLIPGAPQLGYVPNNNYSVAHAVAVMAELKAVREELKTLRGLLSAPPPKFLTYSAVMARWGCGKTTIHELVKTGRLKKAPRLGREGRVTLASVEAVENEKKR